MSMHSALSRMRELLRAPKGVRHVGVRRVLSGAFPATVTILIGAQAYAPLPAQALVLDTKLVANTLDNAKVRHVLFSDLKVSSRTYGDPIRLQIPESKVKGLEAELLDQLNYEVNPGDVAINQHQPLFNHALPVMAAEANMRRAVDKSAMSDDELLYLNTLPDIFQEQTGSQLLSHRDLIDSKLPLDIVYSSFKDQILLSLIAEKHQVNAKALTDVMSVFISGHEAGHAFIFRHIKHSEPGMGARLKGEYIAEDAGIKIALKHTADHYPEHFKGLTHAFADAALLLRIPVAYAMRPVKIATAAGFKESIKTVVHGGAMLAANHYSNLLYQDKISLNQAKGFTLEKIEEEALALHQRYSGQVMIDAVHASAKQRQVLTAAFDRNIDMVHAMRSLMRSPEKLNKYHKATIEANKSKTR